MVDKLVGIVGTSEVLERLTKISSRGGVLLRPAENWNLPICIGKSVKLVLPNGTCLFPEVLAGEIGSPEPRAIVVDFLPEIKNLVPNGTKIYVQDKETD